MDSRLGAEQRQKTGGSGVPIWGDGTGCKCSKATELYTLKWLNLYEFHFN